jgi:hypothetical protein
MIESWQWINGELRIFWYTSTDKAADFAGVIAPNSEVVTRYEMTAEHFAQIQIWACMLAHAVQGDSSLSDELRKFYLDIQTEAQDELDRRLAHDASKVQI